RVYFDAVGFHPDALAALDAAGEDQALATAVVGILTAAPATRAVFLHSGLGVEQVRRLGTVAAATTGALVAAGVTGGSFGDYTASDSRLALLTAMHGAGVSAARINALAGVLGGLGAHVND